jgi:hypothetical protein
MDESSSQDRGLPPLALWVKVHYALQGGERKADGPAGGPSLQRNPGLHVQPHRASCRLFSVGAAVPGSLGRGPAGRFTYAREAPKLNELLMHETETRFERQTCFAEKRQGVAPAKHYSWLTGYARGPMATNSASKTRFIGRIPVSFLGRCSMKIANTWMTTRPMANILSRTPGS